MKESRRKVHRVNLQEGEGSRDHVWLGLWTRRGKKGRWGGCENCLKEAGCVVGEKRSCGRKQKVLEGKIRGKYGEVGCTRAGAARTQLYRCPPRDDDGPERDWGPASLGQPGRAILHGVNRKGCEEMVDNWHEKACCWKANKFLHGSAFVTWIKKRPQKRLASYRRSCPISLSRQIHILC